MDYLTAAEKLCMAGYEDAVVLDGYDDALIGVTYEGHAVYDYDVIIDQLTKQDGMAVDEAIEWVEYNIIRALPYAGEMAPIISHKIE